MSSGVKSLLIIIAALLLSLFVAPEFFNKGADKINTKFSIQDSKIKVPHIPVLRPFRLGLDLLGGTHLVYQADFSGLQGQSTSDAMEGVRDVIERRVNLFGVAEPLVQVEGKDRLVVELAGIKDVKQAIELIGQTPFLEFREARSKEESDAIIAAQKNQQRLNEDPYFIPSALTGKYLKRSQVTFSQSTYQSQVSLELTSEGAKIFADLTQKNLGKPIAIYLDGVPISAPIVQSVITDGRAIISGNFNPQQAKELATRLNAGALPVPISLIAQETVGASLGEESLSQSLKVGLYGLLFVAIFIIAVYRLPGALAVLGLLIYTVLVLTIYKLIPVTLTLAGIAGFVLSLGIAIDANVLIFARMREELKEGRTLGQAIQEGFRRAWFSIRDGHITTLLGALTLYIFTTSIVKGFALTLGIGVLLSLFTATVIVRLFLLTFSGKFFDTKRWLF